MKIRLFSDGSATTASKPGGYGWVMVIDGQKHSEGSGHMENSSNNDAELQAAIAGLIAVGRHLNGNYDAEVTLVSDSQLILGWASGRYSFKQMDKIDQYQRLKKLVEAMNVQTEWVRGHSGDEHNERCDELANAARLGLELHKKKEEFQTSGGQSGTLIGKKKSGVICVWYGNQLKILDLQKNIAEDYNRDVHGSRGSIWEIRGDKTR